jgi:hypothetical protein
LEEISRKKEVVKVKTLAKQFDLLQVTKAGPAYAFDSGVAQSGWRISGTTIFINDTYYDLAGLSMDAKTLFFEAAGMQEPYPIARVGGAITAGDSAGIMDIMTTSPLTDAELTQMLIYANLDGSQLSFEQTVYFRYRIMSFNVDNLAGGYMVTTSDNQLGSLEPTASDRIYCYRVVAMGPNNADGTYLTAAARYLLKATAKEEPEFEYLMRLKRSYDLQQRFDED